MELMPPVQQQVGPSFDFPTTASSPTIVVQTSAPREKRLGSGGWFARSAMTTLGIVAVLMGIPLVISILFCGGLIGLTGVAASSASQAMQQRTAQAKKLAWPVLREEGVTEIAKDSTAVQLGNDVIFSGTGKKNGKPVSFTFEFQVVEFDKTTEWHMKRMMVDGKIIRERTD